MLPPLRSTPTAASLALALFVVGSLVACSPSQAPNGDASTPAAAPTAVAAEGAIAPDMSNDRCKLLPPEQVETYRKAHDLFTSAPGLKPKFEKGQTLSFGTDVAFEWDQVAAKPLTMSVTLLRDCSESDAQAYAPLAEATPGSGVVSTQIRPQIPGSDFADGTPGVVRVQFTEVDASTMTGKTTVVGEYSVRLVGSKE